VVAKQPLVLISGQNPPSRPIRVNEPLRYFLRKLFIATLSARYPRSKLSPSSFEISYPAIKIQAYRLLPCGPFPRIKHAKPSLNLHALTPRQSIDLTFANLTLAFIYKFNKVISGHEFSFLLHLWFADQIGTGSWPPFFITH
ncbi:hypothetical protein KAH81_09815, partial [bacterium]|nr:hypothetical protein [bacterium]